MPVVGTNTIKILQLLVPISVPQENLLELFYYFI